jgi:hypothetical protein
MPTVAFVGPTLLARGPLPSVARAVAELAASGEAAPVAVFQVETGERVDLDLRGSPAEVEARFAEPPRGEPGPERGIEPARPGPGRPRLGVVSREVSLLPRHWDWLAGQRGGASAAIRRLVELASREGRSNPAAQGSRDAGHKLLWALGGDLPGFEEAGRRYFARDRAGFAEAVGAWPEGLAGLLVERMDAWLGAEAAGAASP